MKIFIIKIVVFIIIIFFAQIAIYYMDGGDERFYPQKVEHVHSVFDRNPDIIYFGDSVITNYNLYDKDKRPLPRMLRDLINSKTIEMIEHPAFHTEIYYAICKNMVKRSVDVDVVVVPINLRSFAPEWDIRPEYQFMKEKYCLLYDHFIVRVFFKPLEIFKLFNLTPITQAEFESTPVYNGEEIVGKVRDFTDKEKYTDSNSEKIREKFVFHYMYKLSKEHGKLKTLVALAELMKKTSTDVVFYITPVDYESGTSYLGEEFSCRVKYNADQIVASLENHGYAVLDLSRSLPPDAFNWKETIYPNEHLNEMGKKYVAKKVAERIIIK